MYYIKIKLAALRWQFLLVIVNIWGILSHKTPKYAITNAVYFDWRSTLVWLSLFRSNNKLVIILKQKIHKCMTPKWFKITANPIIRGSSFFFNIKPPGGYMHTCNILTAWITTPIPFPHSLLSQLTSFPTPFSWPTKAPVTFSWHLIFYLKNILAY